MRQIALLASIGLLASAACGPGDVAAATDAAHQVQDTTAPTSQGTDPSAAPAIDCACIKPDDALLGSYDDARCGWGPCGIIEFECRGGNPDSSGHPLCAPGYSQPVLDIEAVDCAVAALRDGTPGVIAFAQSVDLHYSGIEGFIRIGQNRTGLTRTWEYGDLDVSESEAVLVTLQDPAYFEACAALAPYDRYECLKAWSQGDPLEICDQWMWYPFGP